MLCSSVPRVPFALVSCLRPALMCARNPPRGTSGRTLILALLHLRGTDHVTSVAFDGVAYIAASISWGVTHLAMVPKLNFFLKSRVIAAKPLYSFLL